MAQLKKHTRNLSVSETNAPAPALAEPMARLIASMLASRQAARPVLVVSNAKLAEREHKSSPVFEVVQG